MKLFEELVALAVVGFLAWQVVAPGLFGLPLFPLFRRQRRRTEEQLMEDLENARQTLADDDLQRELIALLRLHESNRGIQQSTGQQNTGQQNTGQQNTGQQNTETKPGENR